MLDALAKQIQVIRALMIRETRTRFGKYRLGYIWALFQPISWVAVIGTMSVLVGRKAPAGIPIVLFLASGVLPFLHFRSTASATASAIGANRGLLLFPAIRPIDLVAARVALEFATFMVVLSIMLLAVSVWEDQFTLDCMLTLLRGVLLATGLGAGLGLTLCGLSTFVPSIDQIQRMIQRPLFWTSGLFFSTNELPTPAQKVVLWNPLLHAVETARTGWVPGYSVPSVNLWYPLVWMLGLWFFGLTLERVARRRWDHAR